MEKLISFIAVLILFIPALFISAKAEVTDAEYKVLYESSYFLSIDHEQEFNYIIVDEELAKNLYRKMETYYVQLSDDDEYIEYRMDIGNGYTIYLHYYVQHDKGVGFKFIFNDEEFLRVWGNTVWSKTLDLREYNLRFKLNMSSIKNDPLFNEFNELFGFKYLIAVMHSEEDIVEEYSVYDAPTDKDLFNRYKYSTNQESFRIGEYKSIYPGHYTFQIVTVTSTYKYILINYDITLREEDILECRDYKVGYRDKLTQTEYMDNITINGSAINKSLCTLLSDYFNMKNKKIGEYDVSVTYKKKPNTIYGMGKIIVIDNIKPEIYGKTDLSDYISTNRDIIEYLKTYEVIDEIDGDCSNTIEIENLDDYNPNNKGIGTYRFIIRAHDKSDNSNEVTINYQIKNDIVPKTSEDENAESSSSVPVVTSSSNVIPHTEATTTEEISESSSVGSVIPTTEEPTEPTTIIPSTTPTVVAEESSSVSTSEENKEKIINDKNDNAIEFVIKTDTSKELTKKDIENKLKFYGLISDSFSGDIISDYFDSHNEVGEYLITVIDENGEHYFMIEVISNQVAAADSKKEENKSNIIITFSIIMGVVLLVFIVVIVVMNKKKLNN